MDVINDCELAWHFNTDFPTDNQICKFLKHRRINIYISYAVYVFVLRGTAMSDLVSRASPEKNTKVLTPVHSFI